MAHPATGRRPFLARLVRIIATRPRLALCILLGLAMLLALPGWRPPTRILVAWDIGVAAYIVSVIQLMTTADIANIRQRAIAQDEGRVVVLVFSAIASIASLGAILIELHDTRGGTSTHWILALSAITIVLSWTFIQVMFALHYAHDYYDPRRAKPGLVFPGGGEPDYWDFLYLALGIGMCAQVSDVEITGSKVRRMVTVHSVLAYFFNVALLALMVAIAATAI